MGGPELHIASESMSNVSFRSDLYCTWVQIEGNKQAQIIEERKLVGHDAAIVSIAVDVDGQFLFSGGMVIYRFLIL